jgi:hypothetical protein
VHHIVGTETGSCTHLRTDYDGPGYRSARNGMGFGIDVGALKEGASAQWMARRPLVRRTDKQMEEMELGTKRHLD